MRKKKFIKAICIYFYVSIFAVILFGNALLMGTSASPWVDLEFNLGPNISMKTLRVSFFGPESLPIIHGRFTITSREVMRWKLEEIQLREKNQRLFLDLESRPSFNAINRIEISLSYGLREPGLLIPTLPVWNSYDLKGVYDLGTTPLLIPRDGKGFMILSFKAETDPAQWAKGNHMMVSFEVGNRTE